MTYKFKRHPLVVLDPESDEDVQRLTDAYCAQLYNPNRHVIEPRMRAAIRSLVTKPKPKCPATLNIAGKHYTCVKPPEHDGLHRHPDIAAVWS